MPAPLTLPQQHLHLVHPIFSTQANHVPPVAYTHPELPVPPHPHPMAHLRASPASLLQRTLQCVPVMRTSSHMHAHCCDKASLWPTLAARVKQQWLTHADTWRLMPQLLTRKPIGQQE